MPQQIPTITLNTFVVKSQINSSGVLITIGRKTLAKHSSHLMLFLFMNNFTSEGGKTEATAHSAKNTRRKNKRATIGVIVLCVTNLGKLTRHALLTTVIVPTTSRSKWLTRDDPSLMPARQSQSVLFALI